MGAFGTPHFFLPPATPLHIESLQWKQRPGDGEQRDEVERDASRSYPEAAVARGGAEGGRRGGGTGHSDVAFV